MMRINSRKMTTTRRTHQWVLFLFVIKTQPPASRDFKIIDNKKTQIKGFMTKIQKFIDKIQKSIAVILPVFKV